MHEYSITETIVNIIRAELKDREYSKVVRVTIVLGRMTGFSSEAIEHYFRIMNKDTEMENTPLLFDYKGAVIFCEKCNKEYDQDDFLLYCPVCSSTVGISVVSGREFYIDSIEVE